MTGIVGLLLIQRIPDLTDAELRRLWPRYINAVYQALDAERRRGIRPQRASLWEHE